MTVDIVFPDKNEDQLIARAQTLGIAELMLVYENPAQFFTRASPIKIVNALLASPTSVEKAYAKTKQVFLRSSEKDLHTVEHTPPSVLFDLEASPRHDALHQRASGLNHILARQCAKQRVAVGFSLHAILSAGSERRAVLLGRISQNIGLCRKFKVPMRIGSFARTPGGMRNPADIAALFRTLGMHPSEAAAALGPF
jgi:hypothetical protein